MLPEHISEDYYPDAHNTRPIIFIRIPQTKYQEEGIALAYKQLFGNLFKQQIGTNCIIFDK
jgi:hypothetical protein